MAERWDVRDDSGSAIVEFIGVTVVLLVPVLYLVVTLARVQAGLFAAEAAAHDAARAVVVTGVRALEQGLSHEEALAQGEARAVAVVEVILEDFGFSTDDATVALHCTDEPCLTFGGNVVADVDVQVDLPGVPGFVGAVVPLHVTVQATSRSPVDGLAADT